MDTDPADRATRTAADRATRTAADDETPNGTQDWKAGKRPGECDKLTHGGEGGNTEDSTMTLKVYLKKFWHDIIIYCAVFWSFGMCVAFLGPTLLDLGCMTSSDMKSISWVFFAQLLCSLIGATLSGYLVERCDANYLLLVATTLIPLSMMIIPFCSVLTALAVVLAIMGINMGVIDCLANLQMIQIFGDAVPPFLQAMHFCYGVGAFLSPMIAEPFLLNEDCSPFVDNDTQPIQSSGLLEPSIKQIQNDSSLPAHTLNEAQAMTEVQYAFWIMAAIQIPIPLMVLSLIIRNRMRGLTGKHQQLTESDSSPAITPTAPGSINEYGTISSTQNNSNSSKKPKAIGKTSLSPTCQVVAVTLSTAAMLFIYDGLQSAYGGYVYSYAVKSIADLNKTEGAYLNALFWGMFALGRLVSIPLSTRLHPAFMLICNMIGCLFAMTLMLLLRHDHTALYVGTFLFGTFLSSVAPTVISLAEQFIHLTSRITSVIVVFGAVGEMVCPVVVGNVFVALGPVSFLGFGECMCIASILVFIVLYAVGRGTSKHIGKEKQSFVWCQVCCTREPRPEELPGVTTQHVKYRQQMSTESSGTIEMTNVKGDNDRFNFTDDKVRPS